MKATQEDRSVVRSETKKPFNWIIFLVLLCLIGLGLYAFLRTNEQPTDKIPKPAQNVAEENLPLPEIPFINIDAPDFLLPSLNESDGEFRTHLIGITDEVAPWLQFEELIRRSVTVTDGLSRGEVMANLLSLPPPDGAFKTNLQDSGIYLSEENYQRYAVIENIISSINPQKLTEIFHLFRPLLEQAYGELGYNPEDFDASVIFTLDEILNTPVMNQPIALKLETVHYSFADETLEKRSDLQKQLLRMGPTTTELMQQKARLFKEGLLKGNIVEPQAP